MGVFLLVPRDVALGYELAHAAHRRRVRTDANHSNLFTLTGSLPGLRSRVCRLGDSRAVTASTYGRAPGHAAHPARPLWASGALGSERAVWDVLRRLAPHLLTYLMSFLTLGIFWVGQQTQLNQFRRSDPDLTWIHLVFLLGSR